MAERSIRGDHTRLAGRLVIDRTELKKNLREKLGKLQDIKARLHAPRMFTEDTTAEALAKLLERNDEQILSWPDASKTIQNLEGRYTEERMADDGLYVKAYTGDPHIVDRVTRPSFVCIRLAVICGFSLGDADCMVSVVLSVLIYEFVRRG